MSRFEKAFGRPQDTSSEDEESGSEGSQKPNEAIQTGGKISKFMIDESSSEEEERKIRSGKTKRLEALEKILDGAKKHANIKDFEHLIEDFDMLTAEIKNQETTMYEEYGEKLPARVLKALAQIEETINEVTKADIKAMKQMKQKAYNKLKQRFKKYMVETGEGEYLYQTQLAQFRENPFDSDVEEDSDEPEEKKKSKAQIKEEKKGAEEQKALED